MFAYEIFGLRASLASMPAVMFESKVSAIRLPAGEPCDTTSGRPPGVTAPGTLAVTGMVGAAPGTGAAAVLAADGC
ncbi:hypothetical protein [Fodinicola feengrottensis]|uniref:Uncharacterized protein n=1 Tax=Fodinicola feengrottensis TaxID=435914 RepID=A0ABN2G567_9ACTN|nr:hypothetical protein [Fodinicola feengrottensis]